MAEKKTLARPYAEALFGLARERNALAKWSEMVGMVAVVASDRRVARLADNPRVSDTQIVSLFRDICGDALDADGVNVLRLLLENNRLALLPEISELFEQLRAEAESRIDAEVTSAFELTTEQTANIAAALKTKLGRDVNIVTRLDKSLLGGVVIRAGDLVIDGSVRGRLADLSSQLNY